MSEEAFTESTIAIVCPCLKKPPPFGNSIETMSPSCSRAKSEIPIIAVPSSSVLIHSCSFVNFNSDTIRFFAANIKLYLFSILRTSQKINADARLLSSQFSLIEPCACDFSFIVFASDVDLQELILQNVNRYKTKPDRLSKRRGKTTACHKAYLKSVHENLVSVPCYPLFGNFKTNELS